MSDIKIDVAKMLYDICEDERVYEKDIDLIVSGLLDSLAILELLSRLEDYGVIIQTTRIDRSKLRTVDGIQSLVESYIANREK